MGNGNNINASVLSIPFFLVLLERPKVSDENSPFHIGHFLLPNIKKNHSPIEKTFLIFDKAPLLCKNINYFDSFFTL